MRTFAELLSEYMTRTGVSDAELARAIGVRRQTIFRWKEGLVARPRSAEDVLRCAAKLRLTAEERDRLLLAAGFPPEALHPLPPAELRLASVRRRRPATVRPDPGSLPTEIDARLIWSDAGAATPAVISPPAVRAPPGVSCARRRSSSPRSSS